MDSNVIQPKRTPRGKRRFGKRTRVEFKLPEGQPGGVVQRVSKATELSPGSVLELRDFHH